MLDQEIQERMRRLGRGEHLYAKTLEEYVAGVPMPPEPELAAVGVHAGSHAVQVRVRARMRELDAPESDYPKILEQFLAEDA